MAFALLVENAEDRHAAEPLGPSQGREYAATMAVPASPRSQSTGRQCDDATFSV